MCFKVIIKIFSLFEKLFQLPFDSFDFACDAVELLVGFRKKLLDDNEFVV